jgi:hypothetical protein
MEHVVFSAAVDGLSEEFRRVASLEEAIRVVEHLRNDLGVEDATVFSLTPVPLAFRTYYRVEIPEASPPALTAEPVVAAPVTHEPAAYEPVVLEPAAYEPVAYEPVACEPAAHEPVDAAEFASTASDVHEMAELPSALVPGLEPREAESEHSLGYFTR